MLQVILKNKNSNSSYTFNCENAKQGAKMIAYYGNVAVDNSIVNSIIKGCCARANVATNNPTNPDFLDKISENLALEILDSFKKINSKIQVKTLAIV